MKMLFSIMPNLQTYYHLKLDFQKLDQHTGVKRLIYSTKHREDNLLQSLEPPVEYHRRESKHDIKESKGNIFNSTFKENVQEQKHPWRCVVAEPFALNIGLNMLPSDSFMSYLLLQTFANLPLNSSSQQLFMKLDQGSGFTFHSFPMDIITRFYPQFKGH